ncbi:hypothetical protein FRB94_002171 [Tulasnella sp. JGI-2019a]|nr:hypothetical protein FRB93_001185 [Tulasnella sp. JGI-2019a]KAG9004749.1 hypothetical protein FRB94_002171 [Tulasnella sp. JGI-2019a]KAG9029658.1 hypothetical protein FRB95_005046 [Tulasnella sp. JGI-2019a]
MTGDDVGSGGSGGRLNPTLLLCAGLSTAAGTGISCMSIYLQLKNYRKPILQRMVVRIMLMVPIYAIASLIALFSLEAAFFIDAVRDIYEAFVIYCFFHLLVAYLGGERSLLILLYGRPPKQHVFPVSFFKRELDGSDPFTFLMLRRGIFQYVYVKPALAAVTMVLKANNVYKEGNLSPSSGYLWVSIVYNTSICISLYCLAMFWVCINDDVKPFRPMPKFLCVKGILFFSFWQAIGISILVNAHIIKNIGPYEEPEHISLALIDSLVCFEMPIFAIAHMFAFSHTDYIDKNTQYAARMPFYYAFRDAFGILDVLEDSRATLKGGVSYRKYEPVEGGMHQGSGRDRRIRAGLRYSKGGQQKYWLPMPEDDTEPVTGPITATRNYLDNRRVQKDGYAPIFEEQEGGAFTDETMWDRGRVNEPHDTPASVNTHAFTAPLVEDPDEELEELEFPGPEPEEDALYVESEKLLFGDYNYPVIDVSTEAARQTMWDEEERILTDRRAAAFSPSRGGVAKSHNHHHHQGGGYGAAGETGRGESSKNGGVRSVFAMGGEDAKPLNRRHDTPVAFDESKAIIDMAPEASKPELQVDGVKLQFSSRGRVTLPSPPRGEGSKKIKRPHVSTSYTSNDSRALLTPSRDRPSLSTKSSTVSAHSSTRHLPDDAVDLVVEDSSAAQAEMTRERRKGEPATKQSGKRKVYKSAFGIEDEEGEEKAVDVAHELDQGVTRGRQPEVDNTTVKIRESSGLMSEREDTRSPVTEVRLTRAITPPPHAVIEVDRYRSPPATFDMALDENPWS